MQQVRLPYLNFRELLQQVCFYCSCSSLNIFTSLACEIARSCLEGWHVQYLQCFYWVYLRSTLALTFQQVRLFMYHHIIFACHLIT